MKYRSSFIILLTLAVSFSTASILHVTVKGNDYSQSYPSVVCPPTLNGLSSQISIASRDTRYQSLENRSTKTLPFKSLRYSVIKDSLVISAQGATPVVWQSRTGSWAGGAICSGPASSQWFSGGTANVTTKGRLTLVNSGLSDAIVDVHTYSENGMQPLKSLNLKSKRYVQISLDSLAPGDKSLAVQVVPRSGRVNAFMIDEQGAGLKALGGDLVNSFTSASKSIVIPAIPNQVSKKGKSLSSVHTLRILAPGDVKTSFTVELLTKDGRFIPVGLNSRAIKPRTVTEFVLSPKISAGSFGVRITSPEPIVASISSTVMVKGHKDFVWSTPTTPLAPLTLAITGLSPLIVFAGDSISVKIEAKLVNGKKVDAVVKGNDIVTWHVPVNSRSITIISSSKDTYAAALVASDNGYGFIPVQAGSILTKVEIPNSNIRVLNP